MVCFIQGQLCLIHNYASTRTVIQFVGTLIFVAIRPWMFT